MPAINTSPSGPFFKGSASGQVPIWNAVLQRWAAGLLVFGYDYVIASRDDLVAIVAPVAGAFNLPAGRYYVKGDVTLNAGEFLRVNGVFVSMFGNQPFINGNVAAPNGLVVVDGFGDITFEGVNLFNTGGSTEPALMLNSGNIALYSTGVFADGANTDALRMVGSGVIVRSFGSSFFGNRSCVDMIGGRIYADACNFTNGSDGAGTGGAIRQTGAILLKRVFITNSELFPFGTQPAIYQDSALGSVNIQNSIFAFSQAGVPAANLVNSRSLYLGGNMITHQGGGNPVGVSINGPVLNLDVSNNQFEGYNYAVAHTSGAVDRAKVIGNDQNSGAGLINWLAANIPTDGLLVTGNSANTAGFFTGFVVTDARVNAKCNSQNGALVSETPIVP